MVWELKILLMSLLPLFFVILFFKNEYLLISLGLYVLYTVLMDPGNVSARFTYVKYWHNPYLPLCVYTSNHVYIIPLCVCVFVYIDPHFWWLVYGRQYKSGEGENHKKDGMGTLEYWPSSPSVNYVWLCTLYIVQLLNTRSLSWQIAHSWVALARVPGTYGMPVPASITVQIMPPYAHEQDAEQARFSSLLPLKP